MIVFKNHHEERRTEDVLAQINEHLSCIDNPDDNLYDTILSALITISEFETGITDSLYTDGDTLTPLSSACRKMTILISKMLYDHWDNRIDSQQKSKQLKFLLGNITEEDIPYRIPVCTQEGYAYYGLFPECYIEAAKRFFREKSPKKVICVGLRSIGTSLSALVHATLEISGCDVESFTLRPKGSPFDRQVEITDDLEKFIISKKEACFAVIDEGPGLSGSSICGTLKKLSEYGIGSDRCVIFPSWDPDPKQFISDHAKSIWNDYRKYSVDFQKIWVESKRLNRIFQADIVKDFSAGGWRYSLYKKQSEFPPSHPHHERRKFLVVRNNRKMLTKWIGFGTYGKELDTRARLLSENRFSPEYITNVNGFVLLSYIEGNTLNAESFRSELADFAANYFSFIRRNFPSQLTTPYDLMTEMIRVNVKESLGHGYESRVSGILSKFPIEFYLSDICAIDGRVMPHEWLESNGKYYKVDHLEHHADQFFHGCQNIAWDLAAFCLEFGLDTKQEYSFLQSYIHAGGNKNILNIINFYSIAYLAFRIGYVTVASDSLPGTDDGNLFKREIERYKILLSDRIDSFP